MSSSVQPSDAISSSKKKSKPGKSERAAKRASSAVSMPADAGKAAQFAAGARGDPVAQPGRYPVVFSAGVGEPTRDTNFALDIPSCLAIAQGFSSRYASHPKYAQFKADTEQDDAEFTQHLGGAFLLGLAQQIVQSHVNMALPLGDFSPVFSTDLKLPGAFRPILSQFGEFQDHNLGTRFLLEDYHQTVRHLIFSANLFMGDQMKEGARPWLPLGPEDGHSRCVLGSALSGWLEATHGISLSGSLVSAVFSNSVPESWEGIKPLLTTNPSAPPNEDLTRDRFDFLFTRYATGAAFVVAFTSDSATAVLKELKIPWRNPSAGHVDWDFRPKEVFSSLADRWGKISAAYARFFEMGSSLASRPVAQGTMAQFALVRTTDEVTVIRSVVALSAPQLSLLSCFPPGGILNGSYTRNVVVSTPIPVQIRATEFCQQDWR